jgi:hypothetical protein
MKWQDLDAKAQRNALIFLAVVAAMLAVLLWPSGTPRMRRAPRVVPTRDTPQTGRGAPPAPRPVPPAAKDAGMLGKWQGSMGAQMPGHGLCTLWLEVTRKDGDPDKYTAAASLSCIPTSTFTAPKADTPMNTMLAERDPVFASLSGAWEKDAIVFRVDKVVNPKQCGFTGLSVSKFGSQNIAAEFQDGCGGGSAVLRKAG